MSKAKLYGQQTQYIPNTKADMGKRKKVYQRGRGSDGSAAGGGRSDLSEWQRSARSKPASTGAATAGTAKGGKITWNFGAEWPLRCSLKRLC